MHDPLFLYPLITPNQQLTEKALPFLSSFSIFVAMSQCSLDHHFRHCTVLSIDCNLFASSPLLFLFHFILALQTALFISLSAGEHNTTEQNRRERTRHQQSRVERRAGGPAGSPDSLVSCKVMSIFKLSNLNQPCDLR